MRKPLERYQALVFDCDGVVLDSNSVKTEAFYQASLPYGEEVAKAMVAYHVANGGISRYRKFEYLLTQILSGRQVTDELPLLLERYAGLVRDGLLSCAVAPGLAALRESLPGSRWMIASGGDQAELREVFALRGLSDYFEGGIFGSPDAKDLILQRELANGNLPQSALFLGDSRFDYQCAVGAGLDFIFLSAWSEFHDWPEYFADKNIDCLAGIAQLVP
ncbi:MAG: haloacid dehalogenase-like hydrolase [Gammaproteobacteria bacterium]|nr:haloacid dehalogenase-like hydrolase [Gammaproteobacteria bacterium]MBU2154865.1 haloacid dehalogenase-like hydrolase [Gammaproteobacteria bacterium]MBU2255648.1 haloacid dehalogenase-like hydrolase [Gammaproteobacteria bacterium]MBU2296534.1 haloacid dehalogenase-like hydrolase [Gammaproteobacteria bacterium]